MIGMIISKFTARILGLETKKKIFNFLPKAKEAKRMSRNSSMKGRSFCLINIKEFMKNRSLGIINTNS